MKDLKVALAPIARIHFDVETAEQVARSFRTNLIFSGLKVLGSGALITNLEQARQMAAELEGQDFDLLLIYQATFADSTILLALAEALKKPVFLWGAPEEPTGERLRLASLSGLNLATHALQSNRIPYDYVYAPIDDQAGQRKVATVAAASRIKARLRSARVGVVGQPPDGMDTCRLDEAALQQKLGLTVVQVELDPILERVHALAPARTAPVYASLGQRLNNLAELEPQALQRSLGAYLVLKELATDEKLDSLAVRCWPEFFEDLHCAACGPLSMLSNENIPCSCEADINGAVSQLILHWLSGRPAFNTDLVTADLQKDQFVLWHCGQAPLFMADPKAQPRAVVHSNRGVPFMMDFPLKPGKVTLARLSRAPDGLRLVVAAAEILEAQASFNGTSGIARFQRPAQAVLDTMLAQGLEHHIALAYGDHLPALYKLAEMLALPVLEL